MNTALKIVTTILAVMVLAGCTTTRHDWGGYSNELYTYYKSPTAEEQQELLEELAKVFARVEKKGAVPPPGLYAEYGNFLFQEGDYPNAVEYFEKEKRAWPESAKFMDSLVGVLKKQIDEGAAKGSEDE
jgi:hypothetical protein